MICVGVLVMTLAARVWDEEIYNNWRYQRGNDRVPADGWRLKRYLYPKKKKKLRIGCQILAGGSVEIREDIGL